MSTIGATQSRVLTSINNLQSLVVNLDQARSRITDVDVAYEMANMTRLSIVQRAAQAILAQANQAPALALVLLKWLAFKLLGLPRHSFSDGGQAF